MAGKGHHLRKGANLNSYWNNYPFEEKNTVTYWKSKLGISVSDIFFENIPTGKKITENEFLKSLDKKENDSNILSENDIKKLADDMNSMSFSEFQKFTNRH